MGLTESACDKISSLPPVDGAYDSPERIRVARDILIIQYLRRVDLGSRRETLRRLLAIAPHEYTAMISELVEK